MKSLSQRTHKYKARNDPISFGKNVFENNTTIDGYELLCIAVTNQAAEDYRRALKKGINSPEAIALEKWFLSDWGDLYCFGMGELLIEKLQKEFEDGRKLKTHRYFRKKEKTKNETIQDL